MFKKQKSKILVFLLMLGILYGCKRQILDPLNPQTNLPPKVQLDKIKGFYENGRYKNQPKRTSSSGNERMTAADSARFKDFEPKWDETVVELLPNNEKMLIVPVVRNLQIDYNQDIGFIRRLCIRVDANEDFLEANIVELVGNLTFVKENHNAIFKNYKENNISGFDGVMVTYDLSYNRVITEEFENGVSSGYNEPAALVTVTGIGGCITIFDNHNDVIYNSCGGDTGGTSDAPNNPSGTGGLSCTCGGNYPNCIPCPPPPPPPQGSPYPLNPNPVINNPNTGYGGPGGGSGGSTGTNNPRPRPRTAIKPPQPPNTVWDEECFCWMPEDIGVSWDHGWGDGVPRDADGNEIVVNTAIEDTDGILANYVSEMKEATTLMKTVLLAPSNPMKLSVAQLNVLRTVVLPEREKALEEVNEMMKTTKVQYQIKYVANNANGGSTYYNPTTGKIVMEVINPNGAGKPKNAWSNVIHEMKHGYQFLEGKTSFIKTTGGRGSLCDIHDEVEAYKRECIFLQSYFFGTRDIKGNPSPGFVIDPASVILYGNTLTPPLNYQLLPANPRNITTAEGIILVNQGINTTEVFVQP